MRERFHHVLTDVMLMLVLMPNSSAREAFPVGVHEYEHEHEHQSPEYEPEPQPIRGWREKTGDLSAVSSANPDST